MMKSALQKKLENGEFVITAEVCPPKGPDTMEFLEKTKSLSGKITAFNVTDNQRSILRFSALVAAGFLAKENLEPIFQISCRDRNSLALQSDLLGAEALGIKNLLPLTGDPLRVGDHPLAKGVFEFESTKLLKAIQKLNLGFDFFDNPIEGHTSFYAGAVVNPTDLRIEPHLKRMEKKIEAGANFFQTQAVFDLKAFELFMREAEKFNAKIIAGVLLLWSHKNVNYIHKHVPGIRIPSEIKERLRASENPMRTGIEIAAEQMKAMRSLCHGVHLMAIKNEDKIPLILNRYENLCQMD